MRGVRRNRNAVAHSRNSSSTPPVLPRGARLQRKPWALAGFSPRLEVRKEPRRVAMPPDRGCVRSTSRSTLKCQPVLNLQREVRLQRAATGPTDTVAVRDSRCVQRTGRIVCGPAAASPPGIAALRHGRTTESEIMALQASLTSRGLKPAQALGFRHIVAPRHVKNEMRPQPQDQTERH
jgi:hypothetical protein